MKTAARFLAVFVVLAASVFARGRAPGWCQQGGQTIKVLGYTSSTTTVVQQSYAPGCQVAVYITNGSTGTVNTSGSAVTWESGTYFNASGQWNGLPMTINAVTYTISSCSSTTSCTLTASAGTQTGAAYSAQGALAAIYSDNNGTSLANPFTAATNGSYFFYVNDGEYDIQLSNGGIPSPFVLGDNTVIGYQNPPGLFTAPRSYGGKIYGTYSVTDSGVVADSATDQAALINKAIQRVWALGGGALLFPASTNCYAINSPIIQRSGVVLYGETSGSTYFGYSGAQTRPSEICPLSTFSGSAYIRLDPTAYGSDSYISGAGVHDLSINSNAVASPPYAIEVLSLSNSPGIYNIAILNHDGSFLHIGAAGQISRSSGGSISSGSNIFTVSTPQFASVTAGMFLAVVNSAGAGSTIACPITSVTSTTQLVWSCNATANVSNGAWNIGWLESDGVNVDNIYALSKTGQTSYPSQFGVLVEGCGECSIEHSKFLRYVPSGTVGGQNGSVGIMMYPNGYIGQYVHHIKLSSNSEGGFHTAIEAAANATFGQVPDDIAISDNQVEPALVGVSLQGSGAVEVTGVTVRDLWFNPQIYYPSKGYGTGVQLIDARYNSVDCSLDCYYQGGVTADSASLYNKIGLDVGYGGSSISSPTNPVVIAGSQAWVAGTSNTGEYNVALPWVVTPILFNRSGWFQALQGTEAGKSSKPGNRATVSGLSKPSEGRCQESTPGETLLRRGDKVRLGSRPCRPVRETVSTLSDRTTATACWDLSPP